MKVIADFCLIPLGVGTSLTRYVTIVQKVLADSAKTTRIHYVMHSCGTNIEGDWDDVMTTVKRCHETLHTEHAVPRIHTTMRIGTRTDKESSIEDKVQRVERELGK